MKLIIALLVLIALANTATPVSIFYCGFSMDYCGQSTTDDVNPNVKFVILAFGNPQSNGTVKVDNATFPFSFVSSWQSSGKKVLISVGGQNGNWGFVFSTANTIAAFISSLAEILTTYKLDGVDLDLESYNASPRTVANTIQQLRVAIGTNKLIIVSPQDVTVIQSVPYVPGPDDIGQPWNYFVPIINLADKFIDFYQPQAYNNAYNNNGLGTVEYLQDVYINWVNSNETASGFSRPKMQNYTGVPGAKLLMGLQASPSAGGSAYYATPAVITDFKLWIASKPYPLEGFMIWDSHWDALNGYAISNAASA